MRPTPDLADVHWFPVDLHVPDRSFAMLQLDEQVIDRSSFLDTRIEAALGDAVPLPVPRAAASPPKAPKTQVAWLFHTSFCASTLLARALHVAPHSVALKEPLVLRRLSDAKHSRWSLDGLLEPSVQLLARPWRPGGAVLIKPTHVALNIAPALLKAAPRTRGVIVTCSLEQFLISNLKKPAESQSKIPTLVERGLRACTFGTRLPAAAGKPPDLLCAAGLQWAIQRELMYDVIRGSGERVRALDMQALLDDLPGAVVRCARWLQLAIPDDELAAHAVAVGARNAKAPNAEYGRERYAAEAAYVSAQHAGALARARAWLDAHVLPAMQSHTRADPRPWS